MKMPECTVCYVDMDMETFNDPRESTETCLRLDCGHAYHSRCIISYLKRTNYDCILCNRNRDPITDRGRVEQAINAVRRDPGYREIKRELNAADASWKSARSSLKKDVADYLKTRQYGITEKTKQCRLIRNRLERYVRKYILTSAELSGAVLMDAPWYSGSIQGLVPSKYTWWSSMRVNLKD
jgi:hypothetical protein